MSTEAPPPPQVSPNGKFYWESERLGRTNGLTCR